MKAQCHGEHAGTEAYVVVDQVRRTAVLVQPWYMRAYPDTDVRERIDIPAQWIWFVLIDRRCPVNGHTTQDEAQKGLARSTNGCTAPAGDACEPQARRLDPPACS